MMFQSNPNPLTAHLLRGNAALQHSLLFSIPGVTPESRQESPIQNTDKQQQHQHDFMLDYKILDGIHHFAIFPA